MVVADDRVLVGLDPQRHVLVGDPAHDRTEVGRVRVDEVHGERDDAGGQRLRLLTDRLVRLVEHPHQLGCAANMCG
jgi:superfamily II helicase